LERTDGVFSAAKQTQERFGSVQHHFVREREVIARTEVWNMSDATGAEMARSAFQDGRFFAEHHDIRPPKLAVT
jgi:hypothetical protein